MESKRIIIGSIVIAIVFICAYVIQEVVSRYNHKTWIVVRNSYLEAAKDDIENPDWFQKIRLWLLSDEAEHLYLKNTYSFKEIYEAIVENCRKEVVEELKLKYTDEYKSRNKKDTSAV